uniref:Immunoglobulin domain n=2 Tax=Schistocephalus solidus TaxID=70667 RepID=A0A0X3PKA9_SCHSO
MAFVVFPSVSASDIRNNPDTLPNPVAVSEPGSSESRLLIRKATIHDSGLYICSVLTESGRDDRKLVRVSIKDSQAQGMKDDSASNFPHRLTLYIAAPVAVFLICLSVICYCLISRHTRRTQQLNGNSYARATLPSGQQRTSARPEHASAVSNNSMGAYRAGVNGKTVLTPNSNAPLDHRAHSTQGKNLGSPVANPIIYSSSTGSHSLSGASTSTPGSMLLANTIVQVMPPDGSGYPMMKPNGHPHNGCPAVTVTGPHEHYNSPGMMYVPTGMTGVYHDYSGQQVTQQAG